MNPYCESKDAPLVPTLAVALFLCGAVRGWVVTVFAWQTAFRQDTFDCVPACGISVPSVEVVGGLPARSRCFCYAGEAWRSEETP
jgi:hypothetical protein